MPGRILTLQRQVRELGRLRAGLSVPSSNGKLRPKASPNWILTSPNRDYIDAAAAIWGGPVDLWQPLGSGPQVWRVITERPRIPAILPPGDPINQAYEMWSAGGCQRRCDGETEQRTQKPCLCRAQFGDDFHQQPVLDPDTRRPQRCQIHTRLSVFLPDLPDIGMWRVESHGYWPGVRITGYVEFIKGQVGSQVMVPIGLGIEPRTKVTDGKTSHYVEIVVSLWNPVTFGEIAASPQVLAIGGPADDRVIEAAPERPAIAGPAAEPAPVNGNGQPKSVPLSPAGWRARFAAAQTVDELRAMWTPAGEDGALDDETRTAFWDAKRRIDNALAGTGVSATVAAAQAAAEAGGGPVEVLSAAAAVAGQPVGGEAEPDRDAAWTRVLALAAERGWNTDETVARMKDVVGKDQYDGDGWDFSIFAEQIESGRVK